MPTIHLIVGFMGFGKTTLVKQLEQKIPALRLTHDEFMVRLYGRSMPYEEFRCNYDKVDSMLWDLAHKIIKSGTDVIMDYGFWTHNDRERAYQMAKNITADVVFHYVYCDMETAKQRILQRSKDNPDELYISEDEFDTLAQKYEPWNYQDDYPVVLHNLPNTKYIGEIVQLKIDRPLKSKHPKFGYEYPLNYGFVPYTMSGDGEELDAYVLMEDKPLSKYTGRCIGIIHRLTENDDKLVVIPEAYDMDDELIEKDVAFQEQWFPHILIRNPKITKTHFGVYGAIIKDGKILLIKKARGPYKGLYDLPGGSQEKNESYIDTLKREISEETGCETLTAQNERFKSIIFSDFTVESGEKGVLQHDAVLYDAKIKGEPKATGDDKDSAGAIWMNISDLSENNATPYALIAANKPLIAVADENDEVISTHLRGTIAKPHRYPMIASVLLFNSKGELLIHKIAAHKKWGGLWNYSAAGHVDAGEDYRTAAARELHEELGIVTKIEQEIAAFAVIRDEKKVAYHHVFIAYSDDKISYDTTEIAEVRFVSLSELHKSMTEHSDEYFDAFRTAMKVYEEKI